MSMTSETMAIFDQRASPVETHGGHVVYVFTYVFEFPVNTIKAWIINDYHEQGNIIITTLLLPLGQISSNDCLYSHRSYIVMNPLTYCASKTLKPSSMS